MTRYFFAPLLLAAAQVSSGPQAAEEQLARHRNLGKAFYENPTTQSQAVSEFGKALALAPNSPREHLNYGLALLAAGKSAEGIGEIEKVQKQQPALPHSWFNLGVQWKKAGEYDKAQAQFEGFVKRVPGEPAGHYNLGVLHKLANRNNEAITAFEAAARLNPGLAAPHFQLYNLYRQAGRREEGAAQLKLFQAAKEASSNSPSSEDMEWSWYSEIFDEVDLAASAASTDAPREWKFAVRRLSPPIPGALTRPIVFDAQGDGRPDFALAVGGQLRLYAGLLAPSTIARQVRFAAPADFNNDGQTDLLLLTERGPELMVNNRGAFAAAAKALPAQAAQYDLAVWLDYDHDYDLDILLFGPTANTLLRNEGGGNFGERTADFPFAKGHATGAVSFRLVPDSKSFDLAVSYRDRPGVLYRDKLAGKFEARDFPVVPQGATLMGVLDADNSSTLDLHYESGAKATLLLNTSAPNQDTKLEWTPVETAAPLVAADWENRGVDDLIAGGIATRLAGSRRYQAGAAVAGLPAAAAYATGDFNGDGKADLISITADGAVHLATNMTLTPFQSMRISLGGIKNPKLAPGSEVEIKNAGRYQKKVYAGLPLVVGIRDAKKLDAVRITWPNGLIQSEASQMVKPQVYQEAQRLSGSCPQVWTWNGREFVYISDILGVAPLGAMSGDGDFFAVDHSEHIQIPAGALAPRHGRYEIRLTEELSEVAYVDQAKLLAVDYPAGHSVWVNEKFQAPPFPELKLYATGRRLMPAKVSQKAGEGFSISIGPEARALRRPILVLTGWVDWADGSQFRAAAQSKGGELRLPSLEALVEGKWQTVLTDMGLPAGKPKSIVVELKPEWLAGGALRIPSNLAVFWTGAFLADELTAPKIAATVLPEQADLHFRGFSRAVIDPSRRVPEQFFYPSPLPSSMWNPTPGNYTRFGDVAALTSAVDDRFVIMGSGDELTLSFDASAFPPVAPGFERSFVLAVDGWAKDRDANTAHSATVEPLPFHGMSAYPYPETQHFPDTPAHRAWRKEYNTRPALRLLRPLSLNKP